MKFSTTAMHMLKVLAVIASFTPSVHTQVVQNDGITSLGRISAVGSSFTRFKTDGWIDGDTLFIVTNAEQSNAQILSVPISRNSTTGKIMDFDFASNTTIRSIPDLTHLARDPTTGQFATSTTMGISIWSSNFLTDTVNAVETVITTNIGGVGITDTASGNTIEFEYAYGVSFSPVITDAAGHGKLIVNSGESFWEIDYDGNANPALTSASLFSAHDTYTGGFAFIPSGPNKNDLIYTTYDLYILGRITLDPTTGRPINKYEALLTEIADGFNEDIWALIFDPQTNDLFVSSYSSTSSNADKQVFYHFEGFAPGIDTAVVTNGISAEIRLFPQVVFGARRRELRGENAPWDKVHRRLSKSSKVGKGGSGSGSGSTGVATDPAEVSNNILLAATPDDAATYTEGVLAAIIDDQSFDDVLDGGDATAFIANLLVVENAITNIANSAAAQSLTGDDATNFAASIDRINALLAILRGIVP